MGELRGDVAALARPSVADRGQLYLYFPCFVQCSELVSYWLRKILTLTYTLIFDASIDHCNGLVR